jgi:hypothetical protein
MPFKKLTLVFLVLLSFVANAQNKKTAEDKVPHTGYTPFKTSSKKIPNTGYTPFPVLKLKDDTARIKYISLLTDTVQYTPAHYYITAIIDSTKTFDSIGFSLQPKSGKHQRLSFKGGTVNHLTNYIDKKVKKDTSLYPVVMILRNFDIKDERFNKYGDETHVRFAFEFASVYKHDTIEINNFSGENGFRTPFGDKKNYDSLFSMTGDMWKKVDVYVKDLVDRHPTFCKGVKIKVRVRTTPATQDSIFYDSHYQLTWDDYKGEAEVPDRILSSFFIDYDGDSKYDSNYVVLDLSLAPAFLRSASWVHGLPQKKEVLHHENYKFRLLYLQMLKLKKELETVNVTRDNYSVIISASYKKAMKEFSFDASAYDKDTNIGLRKKEQQRWEETIDTAIAAFN